MGRRGDWSVLGYGSDPIDADVDEFVEQATHYELMADAITSQISTLRHLSNEGQGEYADALRSSCKKLADNLEKAEGRFRTVADELNDLVPKLEEALEETRLARIQAENAQSDMDTAVNQGHQPGVPASTRTDEELPSGKDPVTLENDYDTAETARGTARTRAQNAVSAWDTAASNAAAKIRKASDDDMKDGRFEGFKAWVKKHADLLREISKWLGRIVLVLTVVILLMSNPAGWLVAVALIASVALLAVDTMLAVAGEGSWFDVALSALGVLTLGLGPLLKGLGSIARTGALTRLGAQRGLSASLSTLASRFSNSGVFGALKNTVNAFRPSTYTNAFRSGVDTFRNITNFARGSGSMLDDLGRLRNAFGSDFARLYGNLAHTDRVVDIVGNTNTFLDSAMDEGLPGFGQLDDFIDGLTTHEVSSL